MDKNSENIAIFSVRTTSENSTYLSDDDSGWFF